MNPLVAYFVAQARKQPVATAQFAAFELWRRGRIRLVNSLERAIPKLASEGLDRRFAPFFPAAARDATAFCRAFPRAQETVRAAADIVCRHEFRFLGEPVRFPAGVDWQIDPLTGYRWPLDSPSRISLTGAALGADIKRPWELARFHHLLPLGIAGLLDPDPRYPSEFSAQILDWIDKNPYPLGIHWAMPMEAAVRAVNWTAAAAFIARQDSIPGSAWEKLLGSLFLHARHIRAHLEWNPVARGNHYLACLVGLLHLGVLFRDLPEGRRWLEFARRALRRELAAQVGEDGVAHEGSTGYHAFVTELVLSAALLAARADDPATFGSSPRIALEHAWGQPFVARLERMFAFLAAARAGRSALPLWGDSDDGRLLPLCSSDNGASDASLHLLAVGRALFSRDWPADGHACEEIWWRLGVAPPEIPNLKSERHLWQTLPAPPGPSADPEGAPFGAAFPDSGFFFFSSPRIRGSIRCGPLGIRGWANHAHCDQLSFEFCFDGRPIIVDPGTCAYSGDPAARNLFRSTRYHNTVVVDATEQNRFWPGLLFRIVDDTRSRLDRFAATEDRVEFAGRHFGYQRLPQRAVVERRLMHDRACDLLQVTDNIAGAGEARLEWCFHFAPGLAPRQVPSPQVPVGEALSNERSAGLLFHSAWKAGPVTLQVMASAPPCEIEACVEDGWVAPHYGQREPAKILRIGWRGQLPARAEFLFTASGPTAPPEPQPL